MIEQSVINLAQAVAALGAVGILALLFILWIAGVLHTRKELEEIRAGFAQQTLDHAKRDEERNAEWTGALAYREKLRLEAVEDRKQADLRIEGLTTAIKEGAGLTQRTLDLNQSLYEELMQRTREQDRAPTARTRRSDRVQRGG